MELVASNRPFMYFPLGHHFEQIFHVPHRLARYGAGRRMDYLTSTPESIAAAIAAEIANPAAYQPIDHGAVGRVAASIAECCNRSATGQPGTTLDPDYAAAHRPPPRPGEFAGAACPAQHILREQQRATRPNTKRGRAAPVRTPAAATCARSCRASGQRG